MPIRTIIFGLTIALLATTTLVAQDDEKKSTTAKKNAVMEKAKAEGVAKNKEDINLLDTDDTWRKETLFFPFPFARDIKLEGEIDVRFSKGWSKQNSPLFWSYALGWNITRKEKLSETELEGIMQSYLGGLMKAVNRDKDFTVPDAIAVFTETSNDAGEVKYKGKIRMHDSFFSKKTVTLNVIGEYTFSEADQRSKLIFKLSPQDLDHEAWEYLNKAKLR